MRSNENMQVLKVLLEYILGYFLANKQINGYILCISVTE